ncbi:MAG: M20/M25/M40 family metallo-hydrolase [Chloroflexota bacterium]|nr:MAG: M20/M25/M40 family metallo-hydrolase [Chloroflexota bacterium]
MNVDVLLSRVDEAADEIVTLLQELVRIPTVNTGLMPTGDETRICELAAAKLAREGLSAEILESAPGRGNLIARLPGTDGRPRLLFMSHTDVVPVEDGKLWKHPPFGGEIHDGRVCGRGAADDKYLVAAELMAMILLRRAGVQLRGDLILALGADEEAGGRYGFGWLAERCPQKIAADYAINEGGGSPLQLDERLYYFLNVGEKGRLEVRFVVHGSGCHASQPWRGENVSYRVAEILRRIERYKPTCDVSSPVFRHLGLLGVQEMPTPENVDAIIADLARRRPSFASALRGLSRLTFTPTIVEVGVKSNQVPAVGRIVCDVRTLPHQDEDYVRRESDWMVAGMHGVEIEIDYTAVPSASSHETEFADAVRRATALALGRDDIIWIPSLMTGFADSRLVRPSGTVVYDFTPGHPCDDLALSGAHGRDESTDIRSLLTRTKMLVALALDVLQ